MAKSIYLTFRIDDSQKQNLDALVKWLKRESMGAEVTQSSVARAVFDAGLKAISRKRRG